jgi:hypothetical protein
MKKSPSKTNNNRNNNNHKVFSGMQATVASSSPTLGSNCSSVIVGSPSSGVTATDLFPESFTIDIDDGDDDD